MKLYIGIDLGTSAMKLLLMDADGTIHNTVTKEYPLKFPQPGWSQQNPEDWKKALMEDMPDFSYRAKTPLHPQTHTGRSTFAL